MKKFFKSIRKKSPARSGLQPDGSPDLRASRAGSTTSLVNGYQVREKDLPKLHKAAWTGDRAKVQQLAKKDPSPLDKEKRTPLHLACAQGHEDIVQELLEWKAKTNIGDADSCTPLMKAVECKQERCIELLLHEKVELDSINRDGNTCLHIAAAAGSTKIVKMLCQAGANMSLKNAEGLAALHLAVKYKHEEMVRTIIQTFKGQVDIEDNSLRTPLMYACQDGSINLVKLLLELGASIDHKDSKGFSSDDIASMHGHHACSQLISDHIHRQQRSSAANTPRSTAGSRSTTPRGPSPFLIQPGADKDSVSFGLPAADAGEDESGDETISKASGKGAGSDSWGDDTDISLADDKRGKDGSGSDVDDEVLDDEAGAPKINLAKLVEHLPSESDDGEAHFAGHRTSGNTQSGGNESEFNKTKQLSNKPLQSQASVEESSWGPADSPLTPRKSAVRVAFKGDHELSEVHDIQNPFDGSTYIPSATASGMKSALHLSPEKQRGPGIGEYLEEMGLGEVDDMSDLSEMSESKHAPLQATKTITAQSVLASDSDWDSTVQSEIQVTPRPGILKKWNKINLDDGDVQEGKIVLSDHLEPDESSDWDSTVAENNPPPLPNSPPPKLAKVYELDSDVDDSLVPATNGKISKEVEIMMRKKQAEAQDSDEDDSSSHMNRETRDLAAMNFLGASIKQSTKEHLGIDSLEPTPQSSVFDVTFRDSDWDSTIDIPAPLQIIDTVYQHENGGSDEDLSEEDLSKDDDVKAATKPLHQPLVTPLTGIGVKSGMMPDDDDESEDKKEESDWDSENDSSDAVPPLPGDSQHLKQHPEEDMSDTDDETVSEWELERKMAKNKNKIPKPVSMEIIGRDLIDMADYETITDLTESKYQYTKEHESIHSADGRNELERKEMESLHTLQKQYEEHETLRQEQLQAEAEEAFRLEQKDLDKDENSSDDEFQFNRDQVVSPSLQSRQGILLDMYQNNSHSASTVVTSTSTSITTVHQPREELIHAENQVQDQQAKESTDKPNSTNNYKSPQNVNSSGVYVLQHQQSSQGFSHQFGSNVTGHDSNGYQTESTLHQSGSNWIQPTIQQSDSEGFKVGAVALQSESSGFQPEHINQSSSSGGYPGPSMQQVSSGGYLTGPSMQQVSSGGYLTGPTAQQIKQRLQIGSSQMAFPADFMDSDDSFISDAERSDMNPYSPAILGSNQSYHPDFNMLDDDVLSYTSTEFENAEPTSILGGPFSRDVLLNMNLSDPSTLVKVQDYMRETKRQFEFERNQRVMLDNKLKVLAREKQELHRKLENVMEIKQVLEQGKLDLEAHIRSLEYKLSEEQEKKYNAEILLTKTKEQLTRKEQQYTSEIEARQQAELTTRNMQLEMRSAQNTIKELEEEREELERQLQHENNTRMLQEQIIEEQRLSQQRHHEVMASSRLKTGHGDITDGEERADKVNAELYALKMEMDRQRSRFKDEITLLATENEELQGRIEEMKNEIKLNEEALAHASMQYNVQIGSLRGEIASNATALEKERSYREKLEQELDSLLKRFTSSNSEKDRAVQARNELERDFQREQQSWSRDMERKDSELVSYKESSQHLNQRLHAMEMKLSAMENELHISNTSLMERTNQLQHMRQEADRHKAAQESFDTNIRLEKEINTKLQVKLESLQEKLTNAQHEGLSLKQQLDSIRMTGLGALASESNEQLNTIVASLRMDNDRVKATLEERNSNLMEQVSRLKEEARNADNRCNTLEMDFRRLQAELSETAQKLSVAEAHLQIVQKTKDELEHERSQLKLELEKVNERHHVSQEKAIEAQARLADLTEQLDRAEHTTQLSSQHMGHTFAKFTAASRSNIGPEDNIQHLKMENAQLTEELRREHERSQMLQAELSDSHKVRNSLEAFCSNLKSTSAHLEEKLGDETAARILLAQEARDCKDLLEHELSARSKLGLRIIRLEKAHKEAIVKAKEAKNYASGVEGQKAALESQLEQETQRNQVLQKEISNLKAHLKLARKKLKDADMTAPTQNGALYADFKREASTEGVKVSTPRDGNSIANNSNHHHYHHIYKGGEGLHGVEALQQELEVKYRSELNRKLEEVNNYLESQARARDRLDNSRSENEARFLSEKRHLEEENANLRLQYEQAIAQKESREMEATRYKQLYESEMRWRTRLGSHLQLSNEKSLHAKPRMDPRLHSSVGNLNLSSLSCASINGSRIVGDGDEALNNKIRAELDRSIAKHLEAAPYNDIVPVIHEPEQSLLGRSMATSSRDYIEILKRKYFV